MSASLTSRLTDLIRGKAVSSSDLGAAALFVLDAMANAVAGRESEPGRIMLRWAATQGSDAGRRAFLIGGLTHILETDDLHRMSVVHPGCIVVPAAWAVAERERTQGRDFLTAVLHGFEAACRIGMAVGPSHYRIWHNTATCGPFGSAMAVAALRGLSPKATVDALGNAGTQSSGLWEFMATGAMSKHMHAGRAAESGLLAVDLAALGFTGPPEILEGQRGFFRATCPDADPDAVVRDPAAPWQLTVTSIKPWPCCRHTHPAIDAAQALRGRFDPAAVERIDVETYRAAIDVCDRPLPTTDYEAKFSLQHCVAAALVEPEMDFASFAAAARTRHAALRAKVHMTVAEPFASAYPVAWGSAVALTMRDGKTLRSERRHAKGDPEAPLSKDEMIGKARMLLKFGKWPEPDRFIDVILALPGNGPLPPLPLFG